MEEEPSLTVLSPVVHDVHAVDLAATLYVPLTHSTHDVSSEYVPAAHATEEEKRG